MTRKVITAFKRILVIAIFSLLFLGVQSCGRERGLSRCQPWPLSTGWLKSRCQRVGKDVP